jgi:O-antigen ligase
MQQVVPLAEGESSKEKIARLFEGVIFAGSLALIALTAIPYGSVEFWWTSLFEVAVFSLGVLWAIEALLRNTYEARRWSWLAVPAAALVLFSIVQAIPFDPSIALAGVKTSVRYAISADPFETRSFAVRVAALALLGILLLRFTNSRARLNALVLTAVAVGAASAVFGIMRQAMQHNDLGFVLRALPLGIGYGQIISRNQFAFMMELSLGLALGMIFRRQARLEHSLFYVALALPIGMALILANSRGGILTMLCQILFLALIVMTRPWAVKNKKGNAPSRQRGAVLRLTTRAVIIAALLVLASAAVVWVGGERVTSNLSTVSEELKTEDEPARWNTRRVDIWKATWLMIKDHPIAGIGFGGYWIAVPRYHDASGAFTPQQAHNDYLEVLASGGMIGLAIFLWVVVVLLKRLKKAGSNADPFRRAAWCGALVALFGIAVHSIFDFGLHLTINGVLSIAVIAIGTADIDHAS